MLVVTLLYSVSLQTILEDQQLTANMISSGLWGDVVAVLGGQVRPQPVGGGLIAVVPFLHVLILNGGLTLLAWLFGAAWLAKRRGEAFRGVLRNWGLRGWTWLLLPILWFLLWMIPVGAGWTAFLSASTPLWWALGCAGWGATFFTLAGPTDVVEDLQNGSRLPLVLWLAMALFVGCFFTMNRQLYEGLQTPHGDSAMYEEHLWNLTHGKGFRSFLDYDPQRDPPEFRLFLGEHVQVVHVLLIPLHWLWSSHLLLELCETLALAGGAIPIFWIARRHRAARRAAALLSMAYLLYFPLHFLDIEVDFKTFRPICFGVPALLFAIDQWERGRVWTMLLLLAVALSAKEDYAMLLAPLGVWIALCGADGPSKHIARGKRFWLGAGMAVFGAVYLMLVIKVAIPHFRGGDVHYVRYFPKELGETPGEMVRTVLTNPFMVAGHVLTAKNLLFALSLLVPLGFLPLFSPTRLAVALPLFGVLCLNQIAQDTQHHFHAPLLPILFWAAAASLVRFPRLSRTKLGEKNFFSGFAPHWVLACAFTTGLFFSLLPAGIAFWDHSSAGYWQRLYVPGERSRRFAEVIRQIPQESKVASTDFIHPRFTHHARSYDYSDYRPIVPDDTDYIVIDTQHRYSRIKAPQEIKEYRDNPEQWELLPDQTDGYFIVLRRRR